MNGLTNGRKQKEDGELNINSPSSKSKNQRKKEKQKQKKRALKEMETKNVKSLFISYISSILPAPLVSVDRPWSQILFISM